jgi:sialidase-1
MRWVMSALLAIAACLLASSIHRAAEPTRSEGARKSEITVRVKVVEGGESKLSAQQCRGVIIGPGVNQPDSFPGYLGFVGWASPQQLKDGTWRVGFHAGYWHGSLPTPWEPRFDPDDLASNIKMGMPAVIDAPTGGRLMITRSSNEGKTWAKTETLCDTPSDDRHPMFLELSDGTILCSFFALNGVKAKYLDACVQIIRSLDGGRTWEKPRRPASPFLWEEIESRMIQLQDGAVLLPMTGKTQVRAKQGAPEQIAILRSMDRGATWQVLSLIATDHDLSESSVAQLPNGRLVCISRPEGDICFSDDGGRTWTKPMTFGMRMFAPNLYVLRDGTLLCSHGSYGGGGLRAIFSTDGGQTWIAPAANHGFLIDNVYGYGAAMQLPDESLFLTYQSTGGHAAEDARNMSIYSLRMKVRPDRSGIDLLPAPNYSSGQ